MKHFFTVTVTCLLIIRCMKVELRHLNFLNSDLDLGNVCPACPKVSAVMVNFWISTFSL